ncbi:MAG: alpha-amylase family glycosyl hydrolase, partial [Patescibacteria group bacterium]|nr:alpha-amylase family glycosyl hydrolase [Patescibacteria group bacterium]
MSKHKKEVGAFLKNNHVNFRVWAPFAQKVFVKGHFSDWQPIEMTSENDGYWFVSIKGACAGQEYKFEIHNSGQVFNRNDPRALHFTTTSGNSVLSQELFDWGDDNFIAPPINEQVIYELHVGTYNRFDTSLSGTFEGVVDKLDYLKDLGINMIELMPISSMLMDRGWGYAIDYIFAIETLYGGRQEFLNLVKQAHQKGIGIIVDVVYNHFGPDESLDLWQFDGWHQDNKGGIYFYNDWRADTPWGNTRPDYGRPEVQQYLIDNVAMWLNDCRVDGLRMDSTIYIRNVYGHNNDPSTDLPEAWQLMQKINTVAKKIKPASIIIAEDVSGNEYITKPISDGGTGFNAQWELGVPHAIRQSLQNNSTSLSELCSELTRRYNNDAFQKIIFSDSHDSAANGGARLITEISDGQASSLLARNKALIASTILLSMPGIPMLFQGQEFAEDGSFNDWRQLDWQKASKYPGLIEAHKNLISLRRNLWGVSKGLISQNVNISHLNENNRVLAYHRWYYAGPKDDVIVVINFSNSNFPVYELSFPRNGLWRTRFN